MSVYQHGPFRDHDERSALPELADAFMRPSYAPTPLNPYDLKKDDSPYIQKALEVINEVFSKNLLKLPERPPEAVIDALRTSVTTALFRRFDENSGKTVPPDCDEVTADLFAKACLGQATPSDLVALLAHRPGDVRSIELAKQTIPFDWDASTNMDAVIDSLLEEPGFLRCDNVTEQEVRYYFVGSSEDTDPAAIIVVRKADVGLAEADDDNSVVIVQRDSFVVDLTHEDASEFGREFRLWLQSDDAKKQTYGNKKALYTGEAMTGFLNRQLQAPTSTRSAALYPGVRSYYAYSEVDTED